MFPRLQFLTLDASPLTHRAQALAALEGGVRWIQLRAKHLSEDVWVAEAAAIAGVAVTPAFAEAVHAKFPGKLLAYNLRAIVYQKLLPTLHAHIARIPALEILINTPATANLIRQGKLEQLETAMQSGRKTGQCTMDKAIAELFDRGTISGRTAYDFANDKEKFKEHRLLDA